MLWKTFHCAQWRLLPVYPWLTFGNKKNYGKMYECCWETVCKLKPMCSVLKIPRDVPGTSLNLWSVYRTFRDVQTSSKLQTI